MTVEKPKPKQLLRPITTGAGSAMNQSQFLAILCISLQAREKWRVHGAIGFGFAPHWLKNWHESFKPITKRSNRDHAITFDSHLKTALIVSDELMPIRQHLWTKIPPMKHQSLHVLHVFIRFSGRVPRSLPLDWLLSQDSLKNALLQMVLSANPCY